MLRRGILNPVVLAPALPEVEIFSYYFQKLVLGTKLYTTSEDKFKEITNTAYYRMYRLMRAIKYIPQSRHGLC